MSLFVENESVVKKIWGKSDTILLIFAGAAAEFALNKAVDWLYYTGKLPADPIGRLFSTVAYARKIVFSSKEDAHKALDTIRQIHRTVEDNRGAVIPDWAYRDVLFMLIYYSKASYELLERKLTDDEKEDVYSVFYKVGTRMGLKELPPTYNDWLPVREEHLKNNLQWSLYTHNLFEQYNKHLGSFRYWLLREAQKLIVPKPVKQLLQFSSFSWLTPAIPVYKICRLLKMDRLIKNILLPNSYKVQIAELDKFTS